MESIQLDNLLKFCFITHSQMSIFKWTALDSDYILEKWDKIIGTKPTKIISPHRTMIYEVNKSWREIWKVDDKKWNEVKSIIYFIRDVNSNSLSPRFINTISECWGPDDLVKLYEKWIGSSNLISSNDYNHIHTTLSKQLDIYKFKNQREYNLTLLV